MYGVEVTFNGMTSLRNFIKVTNWLKFYWSSDGQTQSGDLISLALIFRESRLKHVLILIQSVGRYYQYYIPGQSPDNNATL
jgi:hypothetical protein